MSKVKNFYVIESLETFKMSRVVQADSYDEAVELHKKLLNSSDLAFDDFNQEFLGTQI
jgi:hypothetical protein